MKFAISIFLWMSLFQDAFATQKLCGSLEKPLAEVSIEENGDVRIYHLLFPDTFQDHTLANVSIASGEPGTVMVETFLNKNDESSSYANFVAYQGHGQIYILASYIAGACTRQNTTIVPSWKKRQDDT